MANFSASSGVDNHDFHLGWSLVFDDAANTVTVDAVHTHTDGSAASAPQQADVTFRLNTGQSITINLITARLSTGQLFDGNATTMLNSGPRTRSNVKLSVSADRASIITYSTEYLP